MNIVISGFTIPEKNEIAGKAEAQQGGGNILYVGGSGAGNYTKIQDAINAANDGDTIFVYSGIYHENVVIDKSIHLIGEDKNTTIIDGNNAGDVVKIIADDVTISGFTVQNSGSDWHNAGIKLDNVQNCHIEHVTVSNNKYYGIMLWYSTNCFITNTNAINNWYAIWLEGSTNCSIINTTVSNNEGGIMLWHSTNCTIIDTTMIGNSIEIWGYDITYWNTHIIDTSNTVNGKPVYYWKNVNGGTVPSGAGQIILANCTNVTIENQNVSNASEGIELGFSSYCNITNTTVSNNEYGILLYYSTNCTITNTNAINNNLTGVRLWHSTNCTIIDTIASNNEYGIRLWSSTNCAITNTIISNHNYEGIELVYSNSNSIYMNNFINNSNNVNSYGSSNNTWHSPSPITYTYNGNTYTNYLGNYWDDYSGSDGNGDGIGDTPYYIDENNNDYYPLMQPWENYRYGERGSIGEIYGIAVDDEGNVIVTGSVSQGQATVIRTQKYDSSGKLIWEKDYQKSNVATNVGEAVAIDANGNIYIGGIVGAGYTPSELSSLFTNYIILKYDGNGNLLWHKEYDKHFADLLRDIAIDNDGNVYATGVTIQVDLQGGTPTNLNFWTIK
ncbi:MAG: right-handed parallel beta-helix repeat-containing protein, partial [Thermoplasmata archaeon]|nr:right-handed parallel beta-helix repeat-containing protein [Thermoplasmata archaeon]